MHKFSICVQNCRNSFWLANIELKTKHQAYTNNIEFIRARALKGILLNDDLCLEIYELNKLGADL